MKNLRKNLYVLFFTAGLLSLSACGDESVDPTPVVTESTSVSESENIDARSAVSSNSDLTSLPRDTGGTHKAVTLGTNGTPFGYYAYTPGGYSSTTQTYPVVIFLHGKSERGDGKTTLSRVLNNGIPKLIKNGTWKTTHPMIVISPQFHLTVGNSNNWGGGDANYLKNFIKYIITKYRINPKRIYLTGLSHGGNGVWDYISLVDDASSYIAAAAPVASYGARKGHKMHDETPIWAFAGESDVTNFNTSKAFVTTYNAQSPAPLYKAKISGFIGAGHDVWTRTYSSTGLNTADPIYDPFNQKLTDWMLKYKRTN
jgi:predicted peptidase